MSGESSPKLPMPPLLKAAVVLGAAPLLVGTIVFVIWLLTGWGWLMAAGMGTIVIGLAAFAAGGLALMRHLWLENRVQRTTRSPLWLQAVLVSGLLLSNFPAAAIYTLSAGYLITRYTVRVFNDSDRPIESVIITGPGIRRELGPIAPGEHAQRHLRFHGDGALDFSVRQHELQFSGRLDSYVTGGLGGDTSLRVQQNGVYEVLQETD